MLTVAYFGFLMYYFDLSVSEAFPKAIDMGWYLTYGSIVMSVVSTFIFLVCPFVNYEIGSPNLKTEYYNKMMAGCCLGWLIFRLPLVCLGLYLMQKSQMTDTIMFLTGFLLFMIDTIHKTKMPE